MTLQKIISGGQTGADRAALDWAIAHNICHGGWCPAGRRAEDGAIPAKYRLLETAGSGYLQRTRRNIAESDATLVVNLGALDGGTLRTTQLAARLDMPLLVVWPDVESLPAAASRLQRWMSRIQPAVLNIAGPREGKRPGIYAATRALLDKWREGWPAQEPLLQKR